MHLYQRLAAAVSAWRTDGYPAEGYAAIAEILEWAHEEETGELRFLRKPQLRALETYWYLRLVEPTPPIFELYHRFYPQPSELLKALGLEHSAITAYALDKNLGALWARIRQDDDFVGDFRLQSLRETLTLAYPSYILALAMGAGKTILIGAIIATEFAMALEYPDGCFVQNALVFAPGKTILESLRELAQVPYEKILPARLHKAFAASVKLAFTRDGEKNVPVVPRSLFNIVVTNTEKIRIQKEAIRKSEVAGLFPGLQEEEARREIANLRLQTIASLPHLAVFSDEAHHTYGQSLDTGLKKVRKTVDYLAQQTNLVCVVNTTGTPYFQRQPLKDVVIWYGLAEGIRDGILKDVAGSIQAYDFAGNAAAYVTHVVEDFFHDYGEVRLPNGAASKLAIYFPQTSDLRELRPVVDQTLVKLGHSPATVLVNTSDDTLTKPADIDAFNRLNDPGAPHRVMLLVNKGTEGWNCPSLFACALARRLRTSNNFVLQAATRCLRQVPGNTRRARIYLSTDNYSVLDRQLKETYGETIEELNRTGQETCRTRLVLRKLNIPPLVLTQIVQTVVRTACAKEGLRFTRPVGDTAPELKRITYTLADQQASSRILRQVGETVTIQSVPQTIDLYAAAVDLAATYRLDLYAVLDELRRTYDDGDVPLADLEDLARQIEGQTRSYEVKEERVDVALALVKETGFSKDTDETGAEIYTAEIVYPKDREHLLLRSETMRDRNRGDFGFHYSPLGFDSNPEKSFFEQMLDELNIRAEEVEDFYFTGGLTDPAKTDFFVEYKDDKGKWRRYTPDFVVRKKPAKGRPRGTGRVCIVEVKREHDRAHPIDGERGRKAMQLRRWEDLNPGRLQYEMIFTGTDVVTPDQARGVRRFVEEPEPQLPIELDREKIAEFCRKWKITELAVFGSVLREDFRPDSDVDFLVTFADDARWSLFDVIHAEEELKEIVGRKVDLVERSGVEESENYIRRRHILTTARLVYPHDMA